MNAATMSTNPRKQDDPKWQWGRTVPDLDLGLALLEVESFRRSIGIEPGAAMSAAQIAAVCGCSDETILRIQRRAMAKLKEAVAELGGRDELAPEEFRSVGCE